MVRDEAIAVFAYAFAHRKSQDFLLELAYAGFRNVIVIAAPWRVLPRADTQVYFPSSIVNAPPTPPEQVCTTLGFQYCVVEHDDVNAIAALRDVAGFRLGIVAGARIIKSAVIDLFEEGILNIHPGKIPETSGLDVFYYTIKHRVPAGVTAHYIDRRVDAGDVLFFEETLIGPDDSPEIVQHNNYQSQIRALRRFLSLRDQRALVRYPANRPRKNNPMSPDEKRQTLREFSIWRAAQVRTQASRSLFAACEAGQTDVVAQQLACFPDLVECRTEEGWTPLIVASFNQRVEVVRTLLELGADPNAAGARGTTPLMYAKTAVAEGRTSDMAVLEALIAGGADPFRCDSYGRNIFYYLEQAGERVVLAWLKQRLGESR